MPQQRITYETGDLLLEAGCSRSRGFLRPAIHRGHPVRPLFAADGSSVTCAFPGTARDHSFPGLEHRETRGTQLNVSPPTANSLYGHRSLGLLLKQSFPFLLCQLVRFENYDEFFECAGESEWHLVVIVLYHRRSRVFTDIECLVERDTGRYCPGDTALGNLLSIHKQNTCCTFANRRT